MKTKILIGVLVSLLVILVVSSAIPAGDKGQGKKAEKPAGPPEIERGMFVNRPLSSPWWYPPEEETDTYRWAPRCYWDTASLPMTVLVNPTASPFAEAELVAVVAEVAKGFHAWSTVPDQLYNAAVSRDDGAPGPSLDEPDYTNTVSWGTIDGSEGIIAITYFWYYTATKEVIDCDIVFDVAEPWSISATVPSDKFDVWNIATHEAGHTLILGDLRSPKDGALTMHAYTWPGDDLKRTLGAGDILGIQAIYGE